MTGSRTIRVLIVDDHHVVREGLRRILAADKDVQVVGEAGSGQEAVAKAASLRPDVVLMDLLMHGMDGIAATQEIKRTMPKINILVLTLYAEDFMREAIEAGASGYLLKDSDCGQIAEAVHQVYDSLCPIAPSVTRDLVTRFAKLSRQDRSSVLTERQTKILRLVAEGVSGKDIGSRLFLSASTVKREIRNIFDTLGVNDRAHAVGEAIRQRIV